MHFTPIRLAALAATLSGCGGCRGGGDSGGPACEERVDHPRVILSDVDDAVLPWLTTAVGDVGGDGVGDVAYHEDRSVFLVGGPITGDVRQDPATAQIVDSGCGWPSFKPMGDIDGDGASDLVFSSGCLEEAYFLYGPIEGLVDIKDGDLAYSDYHMYVWNELLTNVGDFDGNGMEDMMLSVGWQLSVFNSPAVLPLDREHADATINVPECEAGFVLLQRADINGDGYSDLGVARRPDGTDHVELAILNGPLAGTIELQDRADAIVSTREDVGWYERQGDFQAGGDLFGDGQETLVTNNGSEEVTGDQTLYVYSGPFSGSMTLLEPDATITSTGGDSGDFQIASGMDANADGVGDLLFNYVYYAGPGRLVGSPAAYLFLGPLCEDMTYDDADVRLEANNPYLVRNVSAAGDVSGDGVDDMILSVETRTVGAEQVDYVIHGGADLMERMMAHDRP